MTRLWMALLLLLAAAPLCAETRALHEGESITVRLGQAAERVLVANPEVASVKAINSGELLVTAGRRGRTELVVWHANGSQRRIGLEVMADATDAEQRQRELRALMAELDPAGELRAAPHNGRVLLSGTVSSDDKRARIAATLRDLGYAVADRVTVTGDQQVQIQVQVAEVVKGNPLRSGISVGDRDGRGQLLGPGTVGTVLDLVLNVNRVPVPHGDAFQIGINPEGGSLFGVLSLLEGHRLARTLAEPKLVVQSGETASFLAGGEVPIPIADRDRITVQYKEFGIRLEFTPRILEDGTIAMHVAPEVSSIDPSAGVEAGGLSVPGFRTRRTETTVRLADGESFIIGGLLQEEMRSIVNKVPLLGSIPVLGALFRSSAYENNRSELAIVVTPTRIRPFGAAERPPLPGEELAPPGAARALLLGALSARAGRNADRSLIGLETP